MPFVPAVNVCQAELVFNWDGNIVENVLHYASETPFAIADMSLLGQDLVDWWNANLKGYSPSTLQLINVKLTDLSTQTSPVVNYAVSLPLVGTAGSPSLPNSVACVITKRTALRGRSFRGRIYHAGLGEGQVTGNSVSPSHVTALITAYNLAKQFNNAPITWVLCVISRMTNNAYRSSAEITHVTALTCDGVVDSQRRRLPGRGA